jgi:GNAT superfamily N-acetyltransferase
MAMRCGFFCARSNPAETRIYTDHVLAPAFSDATERGLLFSFDNSLLCETDATIGLASLEGCVAGGLNFVTDGEGAYLQGIRVIPEFRGLKLGGFLLDSALSHIGGLNIARVKLNVRCDDQGNPSKPAFSLYLGKGFVPLGPPVQVRISGTPVDAHLGPIGSFFLTQFMQAASAEIAAARARICAERPEVGA